MTVVSAAARRLVDRSQGRHFGNDSSTRQSCLDVPWLTVRMSHTPAKPLGPAVNGLAMADCFATCQQISIFFVCVITSLLSMAIL